MADQCFSEWWVNVDMPTDPSSFT